MKLYFAGAEIPSHRNLLAEVEERNVAFSFMGLRRRVKHPSNWVVAAKFPKDASVFLDSGAYTVNRDEAEGYTQAQLREISDDYQAFVASNIDRLDMVSEFDVLALGREWIEQQRSDFYDDLPREKFMPLWHPEWGLDYLKDLAADYERVGVPATELGGRNLVPYLNNLVSDTDIKLHGVAMTHVDEMSAVKWDTVSSTSWISPAQYGDTIVWTGRDLKRYPKKYKDQARRRHRQLFEREGFDSAKIEEDDSKEILRVSIWSWQQLMDNIDKHQHPTLRLVTNPDEEDEDDSAETAGGEVDTPPAEPRNSLPTPVTRRATTALPVLGVEKRTESYQDEDGETKEREVTDVNVRSDSQRVCNNCFLSAKCPMYQPGANCAYDIPITIKTKDEFVRMQNSLVEMQAQRVMFMRFAEEMEGGYADPNLSGEMDRLQKMLRNKHDMEQEGFSLQISARSTGGSGRTGVIERLFGEQASHRARQLPNGPLDADEAIGEIVDGDWVDAPR